MQSTLSGILKTVIRSAPPTLAVGERCLKGASRDLVGILIVDDSRAWRRAVCSILHRHLDSVIICESSDGFDAVRRTQELKPDLVLLDIGLPNLNGLEAARQIRKLAPETKILFL